MVEPVEELPRTFAEVPVVNGTTDYSDCTNKLAQAVINFKDGKEKDLRIFKEVNVRKCFEMYQSTIIEFVHSISIMRSVYHLCTI